LGGAYNAFSYWPHQSPSLSRQTALMRLSRYPNSPLDRKQRGLSRQEPYAFMKRALGKNPCFRYEGKTGEQRNLVICEDTPMNIHIN